MKAGGGGGKGEGLDPRPGEFEVEGVLFLTFILFVYILVFITVIIFEVTDYHASGGC